MRQHAKKLESGREAHFTGYLNARAKEKTKKSERKKSGVPASPPKLHPRTASSAI